MQSTELLAANALGTTTWPVTLFVNGSSSEGPDSGSTGPAMAALRRGDQLVLEWKSGVLEAAASASGPWQVIPDARSPWTQPTADRVRFFRVRY